MVENSNPNFLASDEQNLGSDSMIQKVLAPEETILLSCVLYKYNKRFKRQERTLLITTKAIYNINRQEFLINFISVFHGEFAIRRKMDITRLAGITVSEMSSEFVLHIRGEYDYRYGSADKRDHILLALSHSYYLNVKNKPLAFYFKDDVNLIDYTTTEDDKKKGVLRMPKDEAKLLDEESLRRRLEDNRRKKEALKSNTETVFTKNGGGSKFTLDDFEILKVLGRGAFGKVMLVEKKDNKQLYALKAMHKEHIIDKDQIEHTKTERYVLEKSRCPFVVSLEFAFQTQDKIFFGMNFLRGGELFQQLKETRRFEEERAKFYAVEIALALEHLHSLDVIYRDLKPENILLDDEGHICLTDFGMSKLIKKGELTYSFVGTPEYLAPEIIKEEGHSTPADWWSLGVFTFEMLIGLPPFYNREQNTHKMFSAIQNKEVVFPSKVALTDDAKDFILQLLKKDPKERLGSKGFHEIKNHRWFSNIDWDLINEKKVTPPFKPKIAGIYDVDNFDPEFTNEDPHNSMKETSNMHLVNKYQKEFKNFTYVASNDLLHN